MAETLTFRQHMTVAARSYMTQLLDTHGGNVTRSAQTAGLTRDAIYDLLAQLGLNADNFRATRLERTQRYGHLRDFARKHWLGMIGDKCAEK